jgi:exocyst complex component 8
MCIQPCIAEVTNVIKLRHGKETHVYRIDRLKDKKTLLSTFRHASEELAARKRRQREGEHERRRSVWAEGNVCSLNLLHTIFTILR